MRCAGTCRSRGMPALKPQSLACVADAVDQVRRCQDVGTCEQGELFAKIGLLDVCFWGDNAGTHSRRCRFRRQRATATAWLCPGHCPGTLQSTRCTQALACHWSARTCSPCQRLASFKRDTGTFRPICISGAAMHCGALWCCTWYAPQGARAHCSATIMCCTLRCRAHQPQHATFADYAYGITVRDDKGRSTPPYPGSVVFVSSGKPKAQVLCVCTLPS